jgi:uncharacterized protein YecT (DUF1311 family)
MKKVLLAVLLLSVSAVATEPSYSPTYQHCLDSSGGVTTAMRECNAQELRYQDGLLNRHYKALMSHLSPAKKAELKKTQRLWIKYRDANCGFYAGLTGGTMDIINAGGCHVEMTARRAEELDGFLSLVGE